MSKAVTVWPASIRFRAMGPPILPTPIRPMRAIPSLPVRLSKLRRSKSSLDLIAPTGRIEAEIPLRRRLEISLHVGRPDGLQPVRPPFRLAIFVDDRGAHALDRKSVVWGVGIDLPSRLCFPGT